MQTYNATKQKEKFVKNKNKNKKIKKTQRVAFSSLIFVSIIWVVKKNENSNNDPFRRSMNAIQSQSKLRISAVSPVPYLSNNHSNDSKFEFGFRHWLSKKKQSKNDNQNVKKERNVSIETNINNKDNNNSKPIIIPGNVNLFLFVHLFCIAFFFSIIV